MSYTPERVREYAKRGATGAAYTTDFAPSVTLADQTALLAKPTGTTLAKPSDPFLPLGAIADSGLSQAFDESRETFVPWGMTSPWITALTGKTRTFTLSGWELHRPLLRSLLYNLPVTEVGNDAASGSSTNEVQTVTITGTPTGGTFTLTFGGETTATIAYNATASTVQSALEALSTIGTGNVTVAGGPLPGTAVTVTFGGELAATDVAQMTATASFTGGTTPAVAVTTTTPGSSASGGAFKFNELATPVEDIRPWVIDSINGNTWERYGLPHAEITERGTISETMGELSASEMTVTLYPDVNEVLIYHVGRINLPAVS